MPIGQAGLMDSAGQREWIRGIVTRLDRANQLLLGPGEAARLRTQYAVLLRQISQGKEASPTEVEDLLRQADRREKAAVEQLARKFRTQVYRTFRQRRGTFTRRRAAWNRVLADWEAAGSSFEEQDRLIDWLQAAIRVSLPDSVGPLPREPEFKIVESVPETPVPETPVPEMIVPEMIVFQGPTDPAAGQELRESYDGAARPSALAGDRRPRTAIVQDPSLQRVTVYPVTPPPPVETPRPRTRLPDRNRPTATPPPFAQPGTDTPEPPPLPALASSTNLRRGVAEGQVIGDTAPIAQRPGTPRSVTRQQAIVASPVESVVVAEPPLPIATRPNEPVSQPAILPEPPPQTTSVGVNVAELAARTAGVNLAIRALEAELDRRGPWNSIHLRPLIDRLGRLMDRRRDLTLFHGILGEEQRVAVGRLDSPESLISQAAGRIFEARNHATRTDFEGSEPQRHAELQQLDDLSRKLAMVASRR